MGAAHGSAQLNHRSRCYHIGGRRNPKSETNQNAIKSNDTNRRSFDAMQVGASEMAVLSREDPGICSLIGYNAWEHLAPARLAR